MHLPKHILLVVAVVLAGNGHSQAEPSTVHLLNLRAFQHACVGIEVALDSDWIEIERRNDLLAQLQADARSRGISPGDHQDACYARERLVNSDTLSVSIVVSGLSTGGGVVYQWSLKARALQLRFDRTEGESLSNRTNSVEFLTVYELGSYGIAPAGAWRNLAFERLEDAYYTFAHDILHQRTLPQ